MTLHTGTILDKIVTYKRIDLANQKEQRPLERVRAAARVAAPAKNFAAALRAPGISLIAEIKRASPSCGELRGDLQPADLAQTYADYADLLRKFGRDAEAGEYEARSAAIMEARARGEGGGGAE